MTEKVVARHSFCFNEEDNSGESLTLTTRMIANGEELYYNQDITLQSYCNSASINLFAASITPNKLRKLADELEAAEVKARAIINAGMHCY